MAQTFAPVDAVYPPVYFHCGFRQEHLVPVLTDLFMRLKRTGFRVILGVSGHNVELAGEAIGRKAQELLASLPDAQRSFNLKAVSPEHWWMV